MWDPVKKRMNCNSLCVPAELNTRTTRLPASGRRKRELPPGSLGETPTCDMKTVAAAGRTGFHGRIQRRRSDTRAIDWSSLPFAATPGKFLSPVPMQKITLFFGFLFFSVGQEIGFGTKTLYRTLRSPSNCRPPPSCPSSKDQLHSFSLNSRVRFFPHFKTKYYRWAWVLWTCFFFFRGDFWWSHKYTTYRILFFLALDRIKLASHNLSLTQQIQYIWSLC